jgi:hypothetical protein
MKARTLLACAATAAALPLAPAWADNATILSGPQGTGFYGTVDPIIEWYGAGMIAPEERGAASAGAGADSRYDTNRDGVVSPEELAAAQTRVAPRRDSYSGPSWATNPPVPAE